MLFTFKAPIMFALPAFRAAFEVIVCPIILVSADNVPTFAVLACIVSTIFADTAFKAPLEVSVPPRTVPTTFALPAFKKPLAVTI